MLKHPWVELQDIIREKWLTQKALAFILWKKISEVNELLKWKRNITIQWDYLLHKALWTPIRYRINKQIDYDYSLLDTEELEKKSNLSQSPVEPDQKDEELASDWEQNENLLEEINIKDNENYINEGEEFIEENFNAIFNCDDGDIEEDNKEINTKKEEKKISGIFEEEGENEIYEEMIHNIISNQITND